MQLLPPLGTTGSDVPDGVDAPLPDTSLPVVLPLSPDAGVLLLPSSLVEPSDWFGLFESLPSSMADEPST